MSDKDIRHGAKVHDDVTSLGPIEIPQLGHGAIVGTLDEASENDVPYHTPILITKGSDIVGKLGTSGTAYDGLMAANANADATQFIIRIPKAEDLTAQINHIIGNQNLKTGIYALEKIPALFGMRANKICVPYFTGLKVGEQTSNPITTALTAPSFADENRLHIYVDANCPNLETARAYRENYDSDRLHICGTPVWVYDQKLGEHVQKPFSPYAMGVNQNVLITRGPHKNLSNMPIAGVAGPVYEYSHRFNSNNCETALLNDQDVMVIVRHPDGGFRTWGNTTATSESANKFSNVRQVIDFLSIAIEDYLVDRIDDVPSERLFEDLEWEINEGLLKPRYSGGDPWLIGGYTHNRFFFSRELNDISKARNGIWWWKLKCEPTAPLSGINVQVERSPEGYEEFFNTVTK